MKKDPLEMLSMPSFIITGFLCFFCFLLFLSSGTVQGAERLNIVVSILPQKYFVEKIGGDKVQVSVMVEPGANPATYEPRPRQMGMLTSARIYFAIGVPFERIWLPRFENINPSLVIVPTQEGIKLFPISSNQKENGQAGASGHGILDPHVWLSPPLVMLQARNILQALVAARPGDSKYFQERYISFLNQIARTDLKIMGIFGELDQGKIKKRAFMVYHPCWGYFARAYGLKQLAIEEEGKEPKPGRLARLSRIARQMGIKCILIQPQYSKKSAEALADSIGAKLLPADPLAYEWDRNLVFVAEKIKESFR